MRGCVRAVGSLWHECGAAISRVIDRQRTRQSSSPARMGTTTWSRGSWARFLKLAELSETKYVGRIHTVAFVVCTSGSCVCARGALQNGDTAYIVACRTGHLDCAATIHSRLPAAETDHNNVRWAVQLVRERAHRHVTCQCCWLVSFTIQGTSRQPHRGT